MKPFTLHRKFIPLLLFALCLMGTAGLSAQSSPEVESSLNIVQIIPASASGNLVVDLQTTLRNTGDVDLTNLQVSSDLGTQFGTVFINFDDFTPNPITNSTATTAPVYSDALSGADMLTLFDGTSGLLQPGEEISVRYRLQLDPNAVGGPSDFATQIAVTASALDPVTGAILMDPVSGAPVKVSDVSGNGTQPDDSNMPTPVSPYLANLSVGMQLLEVTSGSTMNSLHYNFSIVMKNTGSTSLDGLRLSNDLTQVLGSMYDGLVGSASIVNSTAAVTPTLNDDFGQGTGQGDIFALGGNNGLLLPGQEVEVQFTARVLPTGMNAMMGLSNQAIGSGRALSAAGVPIPGITGTPSYRVSDLSDDTPNPENNNGNGANDPTLLNFAMAFVEQLPGSLTFDPYLQDVDQVIQDFLDDNGGFVVSTPPGCQPAVFTNNYDPANFVQSCAQGFGTNNFSFFYSDACGNSMSFPASISIVDNTGPSCAKPDDVDLGCSPSDNLTALNDFFNYDGQITDLALPVTIETNITAADIIAAGCTPGSQDVDFIFTDACGNVTIRTATISFGDDEAPVFTSVPADQTIDCPATPQPGLATATDNCDSDVMVTFTDSGDATCPAGGVIVRTFTATDNCGNTATTTQTITVNGGGGNDCAAEAGTSEPVDAEVALINGTATIAATPNGNQFVPAGFSQFYVLTNDVDLTILAINNSGSFQVSDPGAYRISVVVAQISDPGADDFFDLGIIEFGVTTGFELLNEFGDDGICGSVDVTGSVVIVTGDNCAAEAGTSEPVDAEVALTNGTATITATPNGNQFVPAGFSQFYVLTNDVDLTILAINNSGSFQVSDAGVYRISVVVAQISDPNEDDFFDLGIIDFGVTTGFDLLNEFGDDGLCGSVDVTGSVVVVTGDDCAAEAGTSEPVDAEVALTNGTATIAATPNGNQFVPAGFSQFYVLTNDVDLTILAINNSGSFQVSDAGVYRISVVVAQISDPNADDFFDLSLIDFGVTTGFDLLSQFADVDLCGSVDVTGSTIVVTGDSCAAEAGTSEPVDANVALTNGTATIAATPNGNQFVPAGFSQFYVLTNDADLTILAINNSGSFQVTQPGVYRISVVVAQTSDPNADDFFDLGTIDFGVTTGFDLLSQFGDTDLCGSVDVTGSVVTVTGDGSNVCTADAGTSTPVDTEVELVNGMAMISATANGNQVLPTGYEQFFVLTNNVDLTILAINDSGTFGVSQPGTYRISVVVAETSDPNSPNFFDLSQIDFGVTTGFDLLSSFGNSDLCGSVDVTGSTITVTGDGSGGGGGGNDDGMITFAFIPANVTLACGQDLNFGNATAMTTCPSGGLEVTVMESSTGSCDGQSFVRTFTATDNCGNEVTATQTVTRIADTQAPVFNVSSLDPIMIFCPDAVVFDQVTATDNCSDVTITFEDVTTGQPCPNASSVVRTYTATDACGNSSTISQVVTIEPQAGVDITFTFIPQDASVGCGSNPAFGTPTAVTNCPDGVVNIVFSDATSGDCSGTFSATRTFTATDNCGNVATASQTITTDADTEAPVFAGTNPTSITADCGAAPVLPVAFDNCSATTLTYTDTNVSGDCATGLSFTRTWTATDLCGNSSTFSQMVTTGTDNTAPTFTFVPFDTAFDCDEAIDFADPIAIDNCSDVTITFVDEVVGTPNCDNGFGYDVYRTFTATDACGNSSTAQAAAWVIPGLNSGMTVAFRSVPADQTIDCGEDFNFAMPTCRSICGPAVITFEDVMQSGSCMNDHVMVRTWTATDDCGSTVSVSRSITREDTEFPVAAVMPQDKTIACGTTPVFDVLSFSDNCSAVILNTWDDVLTNECSTTYRRTWTAADGCGNTTIVSQDLTEVDEEAPEFVMGTSVSITTPDPATYVPVLPLATDNCSAAFVQSNYTTESIDNGVRFVFTAMDACGNASTQVLNVTYAEGETNTSGPTTDFTIFPNPTDGLVTVVFDSALQSAGQIELYDVFGKMLLQQPVSVTTGANRFQVNFPEGAPEGTYLIRLHTASVDAQHRVMRVRN